jgi:hypothetical protein
MRDGGFWDPSTLAIHMYGDGDITCFVLDNGRADLQEFSISDGRFLRKIFSGYQVVVTGNPYTDISSYDNVLYLLQPTRDDYAFPWQTAVVAVTGLKKNSLKMIPTKVQNICGRGIRFHIDDDVVFISLEDDGYTKVLALDLESGEVMKEYHTKQVVIAIWVCWDDVIVYAGDHLQIFDRTTAEIRKSWDLTREMTITSLVMNQRGQLLAAANSGNRILVFE